MRALFGRTVTSDPWVGKIGLSLIATGTAVFFALPLPTFATFPRSYAIMQAVASEEGWSALFAVVAVLSWVTLWFEADDIAPRHTGILGRLVFGIVHGPLWFFVGYSAISATPAAYFPWWAIAAFALAEWTALSPVLRAWWARRGEVMGGEPDGRD